MARVCATDIDGAAGRSLESGGNTVLFAPVAPAMVEVAVFTFTATPGPLITRDFA
jgi:hypothetical protein